MIMAETVRRLLFDAGGEAICDACLAFACSVRLDEMHDLTDALLTTTSFQRRDSCISCRRTVPAIAAAKCAHCSRPVVPGEDALEINGDMLHAVCFMRLASDETIRRSRKLSQRSQRLIAEAYRRMRGHDEPPHAA